MTMGRTLVLCKSWDHESLTSKPELKEHDELLVGVQPSQQHTLVFSSASVEVSSLLVVYHQPSETGNLQSHSHSEALVLCFGRHHLYHHWAMGPETCV
jgi:hypothetical protein